MHVWYYVNYRNNQIILEHFFLLPQDYEDFDYANENGTLLEFLKIKAEGSDDDSQTTEKEKEIDPEILEYVPMKGN